MRTSTNVNYQQRAFYGRVAASPARAAAMALVLLFLAGCQHKPLRDEGVDYYSKPLPPGAVALEKVDTWQYPDFSAGFGDRDSLLQAIDQSLAYYAKPSSQRYFPFEDVSHERAVTSLRALRELVLAGTSGYELNAEIARRFDVYRSVGCDNRGTVLFTGYCEPIYPGSLTRTERFRYPLYRLPDDLVKDGEGQCLGRRTANGTIVPYPTRNEIDRDGFLRDRELELVWLESPLDAYVVHVQGSARIELPDGKLLNIGYAGKNGQPYRSLGQKLIDDRAIPSDDLSLASIRRFFDRNPQLLHRYLGHNESYVFFTETSGGPFGSLNAKVTPMRSIATDKSVFPRGAMAFIETSLPSPNSPNRIVTQDYSGFVLDQDTGGAIRSAGRCDLFIGTGPEAERLAGHTKAEGRLYYIFLRNEQVSQVLSDARSADARSADAERAAR